MLRKAKDGLGAKIDPAVVYMAWDTFFAADIADGVIPVRQGERFRGDHEYVQKRPGFFVPFDTPSNLMPNRFEGLGQPSKIADPMHQPLGGLVFVRDPAALAVKGLPDLAPPAGGGITGQRRGSFIYGSCAGVLAAVCAS